jgi:hypothetical protein
VLGPPAGYLQNLFPQERVCPGHRPDGKTRWRGRRGAQFQKAWCTRDPYYDGVNDISNYRLDVLFGVRTLDGRLATRLSGSPHD